MTSYVLLCLHITVRPSMDHLPSVSIQIQMYIGSLRGFKSVLGRHWCSIAAMYGGEIWRASVCNVVVVVCPCVCVWHNQFVLSEGEKSSYTAVAAVEVSLIWQGRLSVRTVAAVCYHAMC